LRQQPDLRQAVEHDPLRLDLLERLENPLRGFAELQVGGIKQALLLVVVEQAFRRHQLENLDPVQRPAVRRGAHPQFVLGLGQGDVERALPGRRPGHQELGGDRRLAGPRASLEQEQAPVRQPAGGDIVQPDHAEVRLVLSLLHGASHAKLPSFERGLTQREA
jgi:hypothetical protein